MLNMLSWAMLAILLSACPLVSVPGGRVAQSVSDPRMQEAAEKAVSLLRESTGDTSLTLKKIRAASTQIVAGTNFDLELEVAGQAGTRIVQVVLYQDLENKYQLTTIDWQ